MPKLKALNGTDAPMNHEEILEALGDHHAIAILSATGNIQWHNQYYSKLFESPFDIYPETLHPLFQNEQDQLLRDHIAQSLQEHLQWAGLHAYTQLNGQVAWIHTSISIKIDAHEAITHMVATSINQSEQAKEVASLEKRLTTTNSQLMSAIELAGKAETATSVLHNVGNVLNSVNVSATQLSLQLQGSKMGNLVKGTEMIEKHLDHLGDFLENDTKGKQLPEYFIKVAQYLSDEQGKMITELDFLLKNVKHINEIIAIQQTHAKISGVNENLPITELITDALSIQLESFKRNKVKIKTQYSDIPPFIVNKQKVLQILINLFSNCKHALYESSNENKHITITTKLIDNNQVTVTICDNGIGITEVDMMKMFTN